MERSCHTRGTALHVMLKRGIGLNNCWNGFTRGDDLGVGRRNSVKLALPMITWFVPFLGPLAAIILLLIFGIQLGKVTENLNKYANLILLTSADTKLHPYNPGNWVILKNLEIRIPARSTEPKIDRSSFVVTNNSHFSNYYTRYSFLDTSLSGEAGQTTQREQGTRPSSCLLQGK